jgi:hypothetical protein
MIKRILGFAALAAGLAMPAYGQASRGAAMANATNASGFIGGGGGFGSGLGGGFGSAGISVSHAPVAHFSIANVSGSRSEYLPSTFVPYEQAVANGRTILAASPAPLGDVAREAAAAPRQKAKFALVQDDYGNAIIIIKR